MSDNNLSKQSQKTIHDPADPTSNNDNQMSDTTGLTGITQNSANNFLSKNDGNPEETASIDKRRRDNNMAQDTDINFPERPSIRLNQTNLNNPHPQNLGDEGRNKKYVGQTPPSVVGETSNSGDMPDPDSDNNTLENVQNMGMQQDEDSENPKPVDLGRDVDEAEEYLKTH